MKYVILFSILLLQACSPSGTLRADSLTKPCEFVDLVEGQATPKECFVTHYVNRDLNDACNLEREQMRKHSASDEPWYHIW